MFGTIVKKTFTTVIPAATVLGGAYLGQQYYSNGKIGTAMLTRNPNPSLIQPHAQFVQQLTQRGAINTADGSKFDPTTITPTGAEYKFTPPPSRKERIDKMSKEDYDLLVIGGGISGVASAHEATTRGFKVALVDKGDFAGCTSSRSTKLIHGGVRYLEQAFKTFDIPMIGLVSEALRERSHMIHSAPYMNEALPILIPLTAWWEVPYMGIGILAYDLFAAGEPFPRGYLISKEECQKRFPSLDCDKLGLKAALVYFDGQMNDSRHTLSVALTAQEQGANISNYIEVMDLIHDSTGSLSGAIVKDTLDPNAQPFTVKCKSIVNAAGPYADKIRQMDDKTAPNLIVPSSGTHLVLPESAAPRDYGLLVPKTPDGRVLFLLPWEDQVVAGTTDAPADICDVPLPGTDDIKWILDVVNSHVKNTYTQDDVKSVWSGLRPLVKDPAYGESTKKLSRNHLVLPTPSHLVSLMGGKFTTHRRMAQDTIDVVIENNDEFRMKSNEANDTANIFKRKSNTFSQPIYGASDAQALLNNNFETLRPVLENSYKISTKSADYLSRNYGTRALPIAKNAFQKCLSINPESTQGKNGGKLDEKCLLLAEVDYAIEFEMAERAEDVMFRRNRMGFTDTTETHVQTKPLVDYMGTKLNWSPQRKDEEVNRIKYLYNRMDAKAIHTGAAANEATIKM